MTEAKARILVVEDDTGHRGLLRDELTDAGHQVTAVADAEAALAQLDAESLDLVLRDVRLPGASGLELLARCRRMAAAPGRFVRIDSSLERAAVWAQIDAELTRLGTVHEFHSYAGAGHAFLNFTRPEVFREATAKEAWSRCVAWLEHYL